MTGKRRSILGQNGKQSLPPAVCFECTYCEATFTAWPDDCPECGQVPVRVVEPRPVPDL